jgi:hypothetical protein
MIKGWDPRSKTSKIVVNKEQGQRGRIFPDPLVQRFLRGPVQEDHPRQSKYGSQRHGEVKEPNTLGKPYEL